MNENTQTMEKESQLSKYSPYFQFIIFLIIGLSFGIIAQLLSSEFFNWISLETYGIPLWLFSWVFFLVFILIGIASFFYFIEIKTRAKDLLRMMFTLVVLIILSFWPFFLIFINSKITAVCILLVCDILLTYLIYDYSSKSYTGGVLMFINALIILAFTFYNFSLIL